MDIINTFPFAVCPKECPYSCINETTCCNKACLGGCAGADKKGLNQCVACRNISNRDDICIDSCNKEEYLVSIKEVAAKYHIEVDMIRCKPE